MVLDVGIAQAASGRASWEVTVLAVGQRRGLLRHAGSIVPWDKFPELFESG